jgi:hypothetical protein
VISRQTGDFPRRCRNTGASSTGGFRLHALRALLGATASYPRPSSLFLGGLLSGPGFTASGLHATPKTSRRSAYWRKPE